MLEGVSEGEFIVDKVEKWVSIFTNFGVILGLVMVAYQIEQTNDALERETREWDAQLSFSYNEMWHNWGSLVVDNAAIWERGLRNAELDRAESMVFGVIGEQWVWAYAQTYSAQMARGEDTDWLFRTVSIQLRESPGLIAAFDHWIEVNAGGQRDSPFVAGVLARMDP